ncbi:MAG: hypothetical protein KGH59_00790 [Candidatus Micrarchaeota archaeon]|nr:hypothetical protein [Candidatus Micrarchaeota archaeon]
MHRLQITPGLRKVLEEVHEKKLSLKQSADLLAGYNIGPDTLRELWGMIGLKPNYDYYAKSMTDEVRVDVEILYGQRYSPKEISMELKITKRNAEEEIWRIDIRKAKERNDAQKAQPPPAKDNWAGISDAFPTFNKKTK